MKKTIGLFSVVTFLIVAGFAAGQIHGAATSHAAGLAHRSASVTVRSAAPAASSLAVGAGVEASVTQAHTASGRFITHTASVARSHAFSGGTPTTTKTTTTTHHCDHTGSGSWSGGVK